MFKFAREGYPFILIFAVITLVTVFFVRPSWVAALPLVLTLFMLFFFRDPDRVIIEGRDLFYSPADGRIVLIRETTEDELLNDKALEISIFMSAFDVHINRAPCNGVVREVRHYPGRFMAAFKEEASKANEHITMLLETDSGKVVVRQVAGLLARRAVCRVKPGDLLKQGERYGLIKFSSRVDLFLPLSTQIKVKLNDKVKAGETVLGIIK
jgi:phosphatidylserine decarboxylase